MSSDLSLGPLAEFTALREEIDSQSKAQLQLFVFQLTFTGAIVSFSTSTVSRVALMLIVPITTYLLCARIASLDENISNIGRYIRDELGPKVPGGLGWEHWWRERVPRFHTPAGWLVPMLLAFPGAGLFALIWAFASVFFEPQTVAARIGLIFLWTGGLVLVAETTRKLIRAASRPHPQPRDN